MITERSLKKYDWNKIQTYYNENNWEKTSIEFGISNAVLSLAVKNGLLITRTRSESVKRFIEKNPRKHSDETKRKISEIRKEYLKNNPDKVPYLLNHSRNESYPEKYFTELFKNEKIEVIKKFRIGLYELDFSIPHKKINIEIDGEQHYVDNKIVESDLRRNRYLSDLGWITHRIRWSEYQKMGNIEKYKFINQLKNKIESVT